jgi:P22 coat protein - gene protein 5.
MAVTTFLPELWSARLLYALDKAHVATNLVNRNYEGEIRQKGDTVHINTISALTISDYTRNTDMDAPEALTTTDQTLVIDQAKYFNFQVDDCDKVQAAGDLLDTAMGRAAYGIADAADKYILGLLAAGATSSNTIGTTAAPISLTAANVYENFVKLAQKLDEANVPNTGRTVVVSPAVYALLLQDERFVKASDINAQTARNGLVGSVAGLEVFKSNNVVSGQSTETSPATMYTITAQVNSACTYAEQINSVEAYRPELRFADAVKGLHLYGAKVTDGNQIAALKFKV